MQVLKQGTEMMVYTNCVIQMCSRYKLGGLIFLENNNENETLLLKIRNAMCV